MRSLHVRRLCSRKQSQKRHQVREVPPDDPARVVDAERVGLLVVVGSLRIV